jgi:hypothetical protein
VAGVDRVEQLAGLFDGELGSLAFGPLCAMERPQRQGFSRAA